MYLMFGQGGLKTEDSAIFLFNLLHVLAHLELKGDCSMARGGQPTERFEGQSESSH
jgi:hypothetical protein